MTTLTNLVSVTIYVEYHRFRQEIAESYSKISRTVSLSNFHIKLRKKHRFIITSFKSILALLLFI